MGIDIYARWAGQTKAEKHAQYTGFSITSGNVGYLREAYHGKPYATRLLVPEAFTAEGEPTPIAASVMVARLPAVLDAAAIRSRTLYHSDAQEVAEAQKAFTDFVALCE